MIIRTPLADIVIGRAIQVHKALGPGLLESTYAECLAYEFVKAELKFATQVPIPIIYGDVRLDCGYRADFVVQDSLLLEIKSVAHILPIHEAQVKTYLKLTNLDQALLFNFNVPRLIDGMKSYLRQGEKHTNLVLPARDSESKT